MNLFKSLTIFLLLLTAASCGSCRKDPIVEENETLKMPPVYELRPPVKE
jgi:hypothetical protein